MASQLKEHCWQSSRQAGNRKHCINALCKGETLPWKNTDESAQGKENEVKDLSLKLQNIWQVMKYETSSQLGD